MVIHVRFAPSPTGFLHVGNVRTALANWLFVRKNGGTFLLRIDDTDTLRSKPEYTEAIREDLRWLGLDWDAEEHQSARLERYAAAAGRLKAAGRLYACYETPEELDIQRKQQAARGLPPIYNRAGLSLSQEQHDAYQAQGRRPHWRFLLEPGEANWNDLVRGPAKLTPTHMSDPVLLREDGPQGEIRPVYTLASVVDDGELGVTHVIRGEDHVSNTAVQVQLYAALGFAVPTFAHLPLLKTKEGGMSKREGGSDIRGLRAQGLLPMAVAAYLARIGTSDPIEPLREMTPLIDGFSFGKFGRGLANYDEAELAKLSEKLVHLLPFDAVRAQLDYLDEPFWLAVRGNLKTVDEARQWWDVVQGAIPRVAGEPGFQRAAAELLPPEPWDEHTWSAWTKALGARTGRKGKELFLPLRLALTGLEHGPEMKTLLPLLGRANVLERLA